MIININFNSIKAYRQWVIKNYKRIECNVPNTYNAYDAIATDIQKKIKNKALHLDIEAGLEKDNMPNDEVLKVTSGNNCKRLATKQETRIAQTNNNSVIIILQMTT